VNRTVMSRPPSEEVAEELLAHLPCGVISTLPDGTIVHVNETFVAWTGLPAEALLSGQRFQNLLTVPGRIFYETHFAPLLRMQGFVKEIACQLKRADREPMHVLVNSMLKVGRNGEPQFIRTAIFDATDRVKYELELRRARNESQQLAAIVNASSDGIISAGLDGVVRTWNSGATRMFGYAESEAVGSTVDELIVPENRQAERIEKYEIVRSGKQIVLPDTERRRKDGSLVPVEINASPIIDGEGRINAVSLIFRDISERKRAEEKRLLLMREVTHRAKNMLAVAQVVAQQTARDGDPATFVTRLSERLHGLAACQDLLVENHWQGIELSALVLAQLNHFRDLVGSRILFEGPSIVLSPNAAQGIGMALHELSTNAVKYGALSNSEGRVKINWHTVAAPEQLFTIQWIEESGPEISAPSRQGFGNKVIKRMAESSVDGQVTIEYPKSGIQWRLTTPLPNITG